jgi:hypothetical protein
MFDRIFTARSETRRAASRKCQPRLETLEDRRVLSTIVGLAAGNLLLTFDSADPGTITSAKRIGGLKERVEFSDIDFRPATGELYGLSDTANSVYKINLSTGMASRVGPGMFSPALQGKNFGMDFNPVVDRIRIVSDLDQNLRVHPDTGVVVFEDLSLKYAGADSNSGKNPNVVSAAYNNNFNGTTSTTLFDIDSQLNTLATQVPPNDGVLNTVGPLGVNVNQLTGFDITADNIASASFDIGATGTQLYTINLNTGAATLVGNIGQYVVLRDMAVMPAGRSSNQPLGTSLESESVEAEVKADTPLFAPRISVNVADADHSAKPVTKVANPARIVSFSPARGDADILGQELFTL